MQQADMSELRNLKQELDDTRRAVEQTSDSLIKDANIAAPPQTLNVSPTIPSAAPAAPAEPAALPPTPPRRKPRTTKRRKKTTASKTAHDRAR